MSRRPGKEYTIAGARPLGRWTRRTSSGSRTPAGFCRNIRSSSAKSAALAPRPNANVIITVSVKPGDRRSVRTAYPCRA